MFAILIAVLNIGATAITREPRVILADDYDGAYDIAEQLDVDEYHDGITIVGANDGAIRYHFHAVHPHHTH